jgi:hypothetical protein
MLAMMAARRLALVESKLRGGTILSLTFPRFMRCFFFKVDKV